MYPRLKSVFVLSSWESLICRVWENLYSWFAIFDPHPINLLTWKSIFATFGVYQDHDSKSYSALH